MTQLLSFYISENDLFLPLHLSKSLAADRIRGSNFLYQYSVKISILSLQYHLALQVRNLIPVCSLLPIQVYELLFVGSASLICRSLWFPRLAPGLRSLPTPAFPLIIQCIYLIGRVQFLIQLGGVFLSYCRFLSYGTPVLSFWISFPFFMLVFFFSSSASGRTPSACFLSFFFNVLQRWSAPDLEMLYPPELEKGMWWEWLWICSSGRPPYCVLETLPPYCVLQTLCFTLIRKMWSFE